jgi:glutamine amidotransferase
MKEKQVYLVDAGTGNLRSVEHALLGLGVKVNWVRQPDELGPGLVVLPGVGAFGKFMEGLKQRDLIPALNQAVQRGAPFLGICVGMQAMFEYGEEKGRFEGLGYLKGQVVRFEDTPGWKIPHTGWNQLWPENTSGGALFAGLKAGCYAYFNHSYYCEALPAQTSAQTDYIRLFSSMVQTQNLYGVQFHPEKSQLVGKKILENFITL